jgi:hypothetical protein
MSKRSILLVLSIILMSCGNKNSTPPGVLKPDKMQAVLWDIIRADAFTTLHIKTSVPGIATAEDAKLQKQVFAIHGLSKDDFYRSYDYYKAHAGLMRTVLDSMINKANREKINIIKPDSTRIKSLAK